MNSPESQLFFPLSEECFRCRWSSRTTESRAFRTSPARRTDLFTVACASGRLGSLRGAIMMGAGGKGEGGGDENKLGEVFHTEEIGDGGELRV